jgi:DNA-binding XRE family transcriptional regulator
MGQTKIQWADKHIIRFWSHIEKTPICWIWHGAIARKYGLFRIGKKNIKAHRLSWLFHRGDIPDNMCVLHHCDNPLCVNPGHLFIGSVAENNQDKKSKGRQTNFPGETNPMARLNPELIAKIKAEYIPRIITQHFLSEKYGVSRQTITAIFTGQNWRHLNG